MMERFDRFFFGTKVDVERLAVFRFFLFLLVAFESWDQIVHAPRYGAGAFNVVHVAWMQDLLPLPSREWALVSYLLQFVLAVRLAIGVGRRIEAGVLAALYGVTYFWSQLDSYQHHYLMFLLLTLTALLPLNEARIARRTGTPAPEPIAAGGWVLRLVLVQVSLVYGFTAYTKTDADWTNGSTLYRFVQDWVREFVAGQADALGMEPSTLWSWLAISVVFQQVFLAVAIHVPRLHWLAVIVAVAFHGTLEVWGFKIGWFSYYMFTLYLLVLPESLWRVVRTPFQVVADAVSATGRLALGSLDKQPAQVGWAITAVVSGAALVALTTIELPRMGLVAGVLFAALMGLEAMLWRQGVGGMQARSAGTLVACLGLLWAAESTEVVKDYWRFLGGDTRRRGDIVGSLQAYQKAVEVYPDYQSGHNRVGDLQLRLDNPDAALEAFQRSLELGVNTSGLEGAAEALAELGRCDEAIGRAEAALRREKDSREARAVLARCR